MALHKFKHKHNSRLRSNYEFSCNTSSEINNHSLHEHEPLTTSTVRIGKKSSDPILLYRPGNVEAHTVLYSQEQEDLFSACHKDLIDESTSSPGPETTDDDLGCIEPYSGSDDGLAENWVEQSSASVKDMTIRATSRSAKNASGLSWSVRRNEHYNSRMSSKRPKSISPCADPRPASPVWRDPMPLLITNNVTPEPDQLGHFHNQTRSEVMPPLTYPEPDHHLQPYFDEGQNGRHSSSSQAAYAMQFQATMPEFVNAKRMLVEGLRLVCDEARETAGRMRRGKSTESSNMTHDGEGHPSSSTSLGVCGEAADKLNYIKSAFLRLEKCNDPEILEEARRIIPVPLLQRLLQQVQEDS